MFHFEDLLKSFQHHLLFRKRRAQGSNSSAVKTTFWLSSRFQSLFSTEESALAFMNGNHATRQVLQDFCVDVIEYLRSSNVSVLWALKKAVTPDNEQTRPSIVDLFRYLIWQALQLGNRKDNVTWRCARFQRAATAADLFQLCWRRIYLVTVLDTVEEALQSFDGFNIMSAFLQSFHASRSPATRLKIIIIRYRATGMQLDSDAALAVVPVRAVGRGRQQGKKLRQKVKTAVRRGVTKRTS